MSTVTACIIFLSDASAIGYGQAIYLQLVKKNGKVHFCLLIGKSRDTPLKFVSFPLLELTVSFLSVKISQHLKQELDLEEHISKLEEFFWTDSQVVLNYISNESKRFKVFVPNCVHMIRNNTNLSQWDYVRSADNPSDSASMGLNMPKEAKIKQWFEGAAFFKPLKDSWNRKQEIGILEISDPEVKCNVNLVEIKENIITRFEKISNWDEMKRVMALVLKFKMKLKQKYGSGNIETERRVMTDSFLNINELDLDQRQLLKVVQIQAFCKETEVLKKKGNIPRTSRTYGLHTYVDSDGLLKPSCIAHPVLLPKNSSISVVIIRSCLKN